MLVSYVALIWILSRQVKGGEVDLAICQYPAKIIEYYLGERGELFFFKEKFKTQSKEKLFK